MTFDFTESGSIRTRFINKLQNKVVDFNKELIIYKNVFFRNWEISQIHNYIFFYQKNLTVVHKTFQ